MNIRNEFSYSIVIMLTASRRNDGVSLERLAIMLFNKIKMKSY
jgi:hypothetical protein